MSSYLEVGNYNCLLLWLVIARQQLSSLNQIISMRYPTIVFTYRKTKLIRMLNFPFHVKLLSAVLLVSWIKGRNFEVSLDLHIWYYVFHVNVLNNNNRPIWRHFCTHHAHFLTLSGVGAFHICFVLTFCCNALVSSRSHTLALLIFSILTGKDCQSTTCWHS